MRDQAPSARSVTDVDPRSFALADFLDQKYATAYLRLRALGLNEETSLLLASHGLGPVSFDAPCTWVDMGRVA